LGLAGFSSIPIALPSASNSTTPSLQIADLVAEDGRAAFTRCGGTQVVGKVRAVKVKDVVAEREGDLTGADKGTADDEGLWKAFGLRLARQH
jgi:hypothetical protein